MEYLDFELEIQSGSGRDYPVVVLHSPAGEARATMHFPFDQLALESRLDKLQIALLRSGDRHRKVLSDEGRSVQEFGQALFEATFTGEVRNRYDVSCERAAQRQQGLRLKLRIQAPELATLPWEFLYDSRLAEYICLSRTTPLVRYLELQQSIQSLKVTPPLRILGMIANPCDQASLDVTREKRRVEQAVADVRARGLVELAWLEGQTRRDLQRAMRGGPWHIFHFVGHGGYDPNLDEGLVVLVDEDDRSETMSATQMARLLADHKSLRLVLLNSCEGARGGKRDIFSSTASILVRRDIPAVIAMQYEMTDQAAIEFARAFYEALADGLPADAAVSEARKAVSLEIPNTVEWGTPILYMRTPDGVLFDMTTPAGSVQPSISIVEQLGEAQPKEVYRPAPDGMTSEQPTNQLTASDAQNLEIEPIVPPASAPAARPQSQRSLWLAAGGMIGLLAAIVYAVILISNHGGRPVAPPIGTDPAQVLTTATSEKPAIPPATTSAISASTLEPSPQVTALASGPTVSPGMFFGFEDGTTMGWQAWEKQGTKTIQTLSVTDGSSRTGQRSLQVMLSGLSGTSGATVYTLGIAPKESFRVSLRLAPDAPTDVKVSVQLAASSPWRESPVFRLTRGEWIDVAWKTGDYTTSQGLYIELYTNGPEYSGVVYIDDVYVE